MGFSVLERLVRVESRLRSEYQNNRVRFVFRAMVVLIAASMMMSRPVFWTPDTLLWIVLIIGITFGRTREFIVRFVPFLGTLVVYDSMRSIADDLNTHVHFWEMIRFDHWLGGGILPTTHLQQWWWHGQGGLLEGYFYFLYTLHFVLPLIVGLVLWNYRPRLYWPFVWTIVGVSFAAFITYVVFPAAPPWMAKELGFIAEPVHRISGEVWQAMGITNFSEIYKNFSPNAVAAVPSLHSAYPLIATAFLLGGFGWKRCGWTLVYPISMWVGVVYLGEHYVFDVIAAIVYVVVGLIVVQMAFRWWRTRA